MHTVEVPTEASFPRLWLRITEVNRVGLEEVLVVGEVEVGGNRGGVVDLDLVICECSADAGLVDRVVKQIHIV